VRRAFDLGITHFDLANNYGPPYGSAEANFGLLMQQDLLRDELIVSSKAGEGCQNLGSAEFLTPFRVQSALPPIFQRRAVEGRSITTGWRRCRCHPNVLHRGVARLTGGSMSDCSPAQSAPREAGRFTGRPFEQLPAGVRCGHQGGQLGQVDDRGYTGAGELLSGEQSGRANEPGTRLVGQLDVVE
jgi:Aldo/keto reductase family